MENLNTRLHKKIIQIIQNYTKTNKKTTPVFFFNRKMLGLILCIRLPYIQQDFY
jgi:hypothetical protein